MNLICFNWDIMGILDGFITLMGFITSKYGNGDISWGYDVRLRGSVPITELIWEIFRLPWTTIIYSKKHWSWWVSQSRIGTQPTNMIQWSNIGIIPMIVCWRCMIIPMIVLAIISKYIQFLLSNMGIIPWKWLWGYGDE